MARVRAARGLDAHGRLRARRSARRRGNDDPGSLPVTRVTLFAAAGCHLCERARAVLDQVRATVPFELEEVDIGGDPELEARYREWLPVVELDGRRVFTYHVHREALLRRLEAAQARARTASS